MIVVDTNIISYFYISGERSHLAEKLLVISPNWNAPALWRSEFRNMLSQYLRKGFLQLNEVLIILQQAEKLMRGNEYKISSAHVMQLVNSSTCSAYDCEFVALAQYLDVPIITEDKKIIREFPKWLCRWIYFSPNCQVPRYAWDDKGVGHGLSKDAVCR